MRRTETADWCCKFCSWQRCAAWQTTISTGSAESSRMFSAESSSLNSAVPIAILLRWERSSRNSSAECGMVRDCVCDIWHLSLSSKPSAPLHMRGSFLLASQHSKNNVKWLSVPWHTRRGFPGKLNDGDGACLGELHNMTEITLRRNGSDIWHHKICIEAVEQVAQVACRACMMAVKMVCVKQ